MRLWFNRKGHSDDSVPVPEAASEPTAEPSPRELPREPTAEFPPREPPQREPPLREPSAELPRGADRACCCPAYPVVRVVMPPTPQRPHRTDLLLCGHHYRVSRKALAAAGAAVYKLPGTAWDLEAGLPRAAESGRPHQTRT